MFCKYCGTKLSETENFCPKCGAKTDNGLIPVDAPSTGCAFLCFFIPLAGLVLYLVWKDTFPLKAKSCGRGAIVGAIVGFILNYIINIPFILLGLI